VLARFFAWLDGFQQRHGWIGFPLAVRQKYSDDQAGYLGATITYYGFFSIFPLLLVLTTVLGYVLVGHPDLAHRIEESALGQFPVIGHDLKTGSLKGNPFAVAIGTVAALWAGMGAILAAENAVNKIWGVPRVARPGFLPSRLRALGILAVVGAALVATAVLAGFASASTGFASEWKIASVVLATAINFMLFWSMFRILVGADVPWRQLWTGAAFAAVGYELLQLLGGYYVGRVVERASNTYGTFALVIGLLSFIYLAVYVFLMGAEVSVVAARRLWPRSLSLLSERPPTRADLEALEQRARVEALRHDEHIAVSISDQESGDPTVSRQPPAE
jgi:YihY family inner membrane protein